MREEEAQDARRLDEIVTQWSLLRLAHQSASMESAEARRRMLLKYNRAIREYAGALLQHESDADEVAQDILVRMLRGDFANADSEKGKFRHFLKTAVRNMVRSYWSRKQRRGVVQTDLGPAHDGDPGFSVPLEHLGPVEQRDDADPSDDVAWRATILALAMRSLESFQSEHPGCLYHTVLKLRGDFPDEPIEQLADRVQGATGRPWTAAAVRQQLRRARLRFAQILIEEVAMSMRQATPDAIEEELGELGLLAYVQPFLADDWRTQGVLSGD